MSRLLKSLWIGCLAISACVPVAAPNAPETSPSSTVSTPLPGDSNPSGPPEVPLTPVFAKVTPSFLCPGETASVSASQLPTNTPIEVWSKPAGVAVGKLSHPPHPREYGARQLGTASTDAAGNLEFQFQVPNELAATDRAVATALELWFVYPEAPAGVRVRPAVASFFTCSASISWEAPDGLTTEVGKDLQLVATLTSGPAITWRIADEDAGGVSIETPAGKKLGSVVTLRTAKPGGALVYAVSGDIRGEGLIAVLDPATSSIPLPPPSGFPLQASDAVPLGARVITDNTGWNMFWGELRKGQPSTRGLEPPPVDFSKRSLVVVVANSSFVNTSAPVVTHVEDGSVVHVVQPRLRGYNVTEPAAMMMGLITLLSVPKMTAHARVEFRTLP